ncbi:MAG: sugar phosphate isomerase/epimerase [Desulfobacteraceae bacterium]
MKLGLYFAVCNHLKLEEAIEKIAAIGYQTVELSTHTGGRFDLGHKWEGHHDRKDTIARFNKYGIRVTAINMSHDGQLILGPHHADTDLFFKGSAEEKIRYGTVRMIKAAELAHELEIPVVTGFTGCEDYSRWFPWPDPDGWRKMEPLFRERWEPILKRFDELGILFGMECHPKQMVYNTETALQSTMLFNDFKSWKFNLDPANLMLAGVDPVVFVAELGSNIVNVHAKDGEMVCHNIRKSGLLANGPWKRPDRGFRFRIAGWGDVQWKKLITELVLKGYTGALTVEHEDPTMGPIEGIEKAASFLNPLLIKEPFSDRWW